LVGLAVLLLLPTSLLLLVEVVADLHHLAVVVQVVIKQTQHL
jgi:hypothetical protein